MIFCRKKENHTNFTLAGFSQRGSHIYIYIYIYVCIYIYIYIYIYMIAFNIEKCLDVVYEGPLLDS